MPACLFCHSTKLTAEHIWPMWIREIFPKQSYDAGRFSTAGLKQEWKQTSLERTSNSVCRTCNNEWMSRIETRARPILEPLIRGYAPPLLTATLKRIGGPPQSDLIRPERT